MSSSSGQSTGFDLSFKILLIGDSGVGKSSLLVSFISSSVEDLSPTIGNYEFITLNLFKKKIISTFACLELRCHTSHLYIVCNQMVCLVLVDLLFTVIVLMFWVLNLWFFFKWFSVWKLLYISGTSNSDQFFNVLLCFHDWIFESVGLWLLTLPNNTCVGCDWQLNLCSSCIDYFVCLTWVLMWSNACFYLM